MGKLLGIPDWLAILLLIGFGLTLFLSYGYWSIRQAHQRVAAARPNLSKQEFLAAMETDCSLEVSSFLWEKTLSYVHPRLTPHPDDDLILDLKIDDDDIAMDWPREWAELRDFHESHIPDWPDAWPATIKNFGRWLDMAPHRR